MLIFLDLETTGLEDIDKICAVGIIAVDDAKMIVKYDLVNEAKKISSKASSVNHITNEMLKQKPKLKDSDAYKFLEEHNHEDSIIVAHNAKFGIKMLELGGFIWHGKAIDTLRTTKHLIPECEYFSLQFLRYELKLYRDESRETALFENNILERKALHDALITKLLYKYLLEIEPQNRLLELSEKKVLMQKFGFGKYADKHIEEISMYDRAYLEWMLCNIAELDEDLRYTIEYYLD
ncbi:exonuclease domain-containing protein [Sulfurimonas sp.]|uniref:exonuclease domain-containing protein n=1 Tax=Sulfurimonas sp. TaxID=2022749 RepID=UPI00260FBDC1|nr:exonuclease domain-containing protein [Sulfurimonas sp.]MDD5158390.1 exonuclease domain-containing protein [Sulfurimonas sp.]